MNELQNYSDQIKKLSPKQGDLMVLKVEQILSMSQRNKISEFLSPIAGELGCKFLIVDPGMDISLHVDPSAQFAEQQKQTALLESILEQQTLLIQALAEPDEDPDAQPRTYMDGSPCP
jgi:hypothetical protein